MFFVNDLSTRRHMDELCIESDYHQEMNEPDTILSADITIPDMECGIDLSHAGFAPSRRAKIAASMNMTLAQYDDYVADRRELLLADRWTANSGDDCEDDIGTVD